MSLYREPGRRRAVPLVAGAAVVLAALAAGFGLGRATAGDASLAEALEPTREHVREVRAALELLTIEYPQAAEAETEYAGATANVERLEAAFASARDELALLDPEATQRAADALAEVASAVRDRAPAAEVEAAVRRAEQAVGELPAAR